MATPRLFSRFRCTGNDWFVDYVNTASLYEAGTMVSYWVNFIHRCLYIIFNIIGWKWEKIFLFLREIMRHFPWFRMLELLQTRVFRVSIKSFVINGIFNVVPCGILLDNLDETSIWNEQQRQVSSLPVNGSICQFYLVTIAPNFIVPRRGKFSR